MKRPAGHQSNVQKAQNMADGTTIKKAEGNSLRIVGLNLAVIALVLLAGLIVPRNGRALVVVSPFASAGLVSEVIADAGGTYFAATRFDNMAVAQFENSDFIIRLLSAGAILILDGNLASACISESEK